MIETIRGGYDELLPALPTESALSRPSLSSRPISRARACSSSRMLHRNPRAPGRHAKTTSAYSTSLHVKTEERFGSCCLTAQLG